MSGPRIHWGLLALSLALSACAAPAALAPQNTSHPLEVERRVVSDQVHMQRPPVVLVHGIDDTPRVFRTLRSHLDRDGFTHVSAVTLSPNNGAELLEVLAGQLEAHVAEVLQETGAAQVDVVAFSMGALVTRIWMLEQGGRYRVRRWVSISGPHAGTATGWLRFNPGATQMRWNSPLLQRLGNNASDFAPAEVFSLWTPLDLMIVPAHSSHLPGAHERTFPVLLHPLMLFDGRVLRAVTEALSVEAPEDFQSGQGLPKPAPL